MSTARSAASGHSRGKNSAGYCDELAVDGRRREKTGTNQRRFRRTTEPDTRNLCRRFFEAERRRPFLSGDLHRVYSTKEEPFLTEKDRRPDGTFDRATAKWGIEGRQLLLNSGSSAMADDYIEATHRSSRLLIGATKFSVFLKTTRSKIWHQPSRAFDWAFPISVRHQLRHLRLVRRAGLHQHPVAHGTKLFGCDQQPSTPTLNSQLSPGLRTFTSSARTSQNFTRFIGRFMLKAMGLPLPKQILVHGWWQKDGAKISKSTGNVVDPVAVIDEWGLDAFRYYVLRELEHWSGRKLTDAVSAHVIRPNSRTPRQSCESFALNAQRYRNGIVPPFVPPGEYHTKFNDV